MGNAKEKQKSSMENTNRESNSRSGSFRLGLGMNEAKVHTVVELGGFDTKSLLFDNIEESEIKHQKLLPPLRNSLSPTQMKSLVALCDTMLPSIKDNNVAASSDEFVNNFYRTSASMAGTPQLVGLLLLSLSDFLCFLLYYIKYIETRMLINFPYLMVKITTFFYKRKRVVIFNFLLCLVFRYASSYAKKKLPWNDQKVISG